MGVLDEIVAHKRAEVAALKRRRGRWRRWRRRAAGLAPARDFEAALRPADRARVRLIAEVKRASPSQGLFRADLDPIAQAATYAAAGAAAVSVLTDAQYFHGSLDDLVQVRACGPGAGAPQGVHRRRVPALGGPRGGRRRGAADRGRARGRGARATSSRRPRASGSPTLVEVHTAAELDRALRLGAPVIGVNNRDLQTLDHDPRAVARAAAAASRPGPSR